MSAFYEIFPDKNRNAGGPQFFHYIANLNLSKDDFEMYNSFYCGVSGSPIDPKRKKMTQTGPDKNSPVLSTTRGSSLRAQVIVLLETASPSVLGVSVCHLRNCSADVGVIVVPAALLRLLHCKQKKSIFKLKYRLKKALFLASF